MNHDLTVYDDDADLVERAGPFLADAVRQGEAAVMVLEKRKLDLLDEALGPAVASAVGHVDRDSFYTRPEAAVAYYDARVRRLLRDGVPSVRLFGELPGGAAEEVDAWITYDAVLNRAFAQHPVSVLCGYDAREQPEALVEGALRSHPHVVDADRRENPRFHDPAEIVREHASAEHPPPDMRSLEVDGDVLAFRRRLLHELEADGVHEADGQGLVLAVGEVLANAGRHGDGVREVRVGRSGDRFVCEVSDHGPGISDPFAGYIPPAPDGVAGGGLWVARQMTRRLDLISTASGLTARLWVQAGGRDGRPS